MIAGKKLELTIVKRVLKTAPDPETGIEVPVETREEKHLFMEPGGYCKHTDGVWVMQAPVKSSPVFHLRTDKRKVIEHEGGTITVEGPPFVTPAGAFRLVKGDWVEAPVEAPKPPNVEA